MTEDSAPGDKPKIIIDEDWKSRVQAEKEAAEEGRTGPDTASGPTSETVSGPAEPAKAASPSRPAPETQERELELPPASLFTIVQAIASQAMIFLTGVNPLQPDQPGKPQPKLARFYIDELSVLEEKTRGNLSADESQFLEQVLHELRMQFVTLSKRS